jgi:hypothetical protein
MKKRDAENTQGLPPRRPEVNRRQAFRLKLGKIQGFEAYWYDRLQGFSGNIGRGTNKIGIAMRIYVADSLRCTMKVRCENENRSKYYNA